MIHVLFKRFCHEAIVNVLLSTAALFQCYFEHVKDLEWCRDQDTICYLFISELKLCIGSWNDTGSFIQGHLLELK